MTSRRSVPRLLGSSALRLCGVLAVLVVLSFLIVRLVPGDPSVTIAGINSSPRQIAEIRSQLGLTGSLPAQFGHYVSGLVRFDLGTSLASGEPVRQLIADRFGNTVKLAGGSLVVVMLVSVPIGMAVAAYTREGRHRRFEAAFNVLTGIGGAVPEYVVAVLVALVFAVLLNLLPASGSQGLASLVLPIVAISSRPVAVLARIARVETLNALAQDYVRTAVVKRLATPRIFVRHVLPNTLGSTLTLGGLLFASLLGGTVVVETVFAWPGLGTTLVESVLARDYPVIQGIILLLGVIVVLVNLVVDVALAVVDPRSLLAAR